MFYVTIASNQPNGCGYYEVVAKDSDSAREVCFRNLGKQWSFLYDSLDKIHPLDKKVKHGTLS